GDLGSGRSTVHQGVSRALTTLGDADPRQSPEAPTADDGSAPPGPPGSLPEATGRYRRIRLYATGGIGRTWLAPGYARGREVALKELRPEQAEDARLRTRFLREARITGQLEHPGIIPVYELARWPEDGRPYYTMRLVRGRTLAESARA